MGSILVKAFNNNIKEADIEKIHLSLFPKDSLTTE